MIISFTTLFYPLLSRLDSAVKLSNFNLLESLDSYFPRKYLALFEHRKCEEYRLRISQSIVPSERGFNLVRYRVLRVVC